MPYFSSLYSNLSCGTVSNAFEKSSIPMSTWVPLSYAFSRSCEVSSNCVSQE